MRTDAPNLKETTKLYDLTETDQGLLLAWKRDHNMFMVATSVIGELNNIGDVTSVGTSGIFGDISMITSPFMALFIIILMGYAVIKVFFENLKREPA